MKKVEDLFDVFYGNNQEFINMIPDDKGVPFVSRQSTNNGVEARVRLKEGVDLNPANTISVAAGGSVMESFLQKEPYYSGRDVFYLIPKKEMRENVMFYYCAALRANKYRYNYGRQANSTLRSILIPDLHEIPNWVNAVDIKKVKIEDLRVLKTKDNLTPLKPSIWKSFLLSDLFFIQGSATTLFRDLNEVDSPSSGYPYVSTQATNNGVKGFVDVFTEGAEILTVDSAVFGYCSYQERPFSASDHVEKLVPKFAINKYIAMFLVTVINQEQYRYNYGRKCSQTRMRKVTIKLPCTRDNKPDWEYMENYIKSLPYSANL